MVYLLCTGKLEGDDVERLWNNFIPLIGSSDLIVEPGLGGDSGIVGSLTLTKL